LCLSIAALAVFEIKDGFQILIVLVLNELIDCYAFSCFCLSIATFAIFEIKDYLHKIIAFCDILGEFVKKSLTAILLHCRLIIQTFS